MEKHEIKEVLNALKIFSTEMNGRFDSLENRMEKLENRVDQLENTMNERFDRLEKKMDGLRVELTETQETVDYLSSKNLQHEKKIRKLTIKET